MNDKDLILMADDDPEDCEMTLEALRLAGIENPVEFVGDGVELLDHLKASVAEGDEGRLPSLVFLDLNMPRMDGHAALRAIRSDPALADIPIVVLTTSKSEADVAETYRLGGQSHLSKPATLKEFIGKLRNVAAYWFQTVLLPRKGDK